MDYSDHMTSRSNGSPAAVRTSSGLNRVSSMKLSRALAESRTPNRVGRFDNTLIKSPIGTPNSVNGGSTGRKSLGLPQRIPVDPTTLPSSPIYKARMKALREFKSSLLSENGHEYKFVQRRSNSVLPNHIEKYARNVIAPLIMNEMADKEDRVDMLIEFLKDLTTEGGFFEKSSRFDPESDEVLGVSNGDDGIIIDNAYHSSSSENPMYDPNEDKYSSPDKHVQIADDMSSMVNADPDSENVEPHTPPQKSLGTPSKNSVQSSQTPFAIKEADEARATVYSPVRVSRKKDRDTYGSDYVVTAVRRSMRKLGTVTSEDLEKSGLKQVGSVGDVLNETGCYSYTPNDALNS